MWPVSIVCRHLDTSKADDLDTLRPYLISTQVEAPFTLLLFHSPGQTSETLEEETEKATRRQRVPGRSIFPVSPTLRNGRGASNAVGLKYVNFGAFDVKAYLWLRLVNFRSGKIRRAKKKTDEKSSKKLNPILFVLPDRWRRVPNDGIPCIGGNGRLREDR